MNIYQINFPLKAVAKERPRMGKYCVYTSKNTVAFENSIKQIWNAQYIKHPLLMKPLAVFIIFNFIKPKTSKNQYPSVRPDCDNLIKSLTDSLTGLAWKDDAQICILNAKKVYSLENKIELIYQELD